MNTIIGKIQSHPESQQTNTITLLHMYYNWERTVSVNMSHNLRLERTPTVGVPPWQTPTANLTALNWGPQPKFQFSFRGLFFQGWSYFVGQSFNVTFLSCCNLSNRNHNTWFDQTLKSLCFWMLDNVMVFCFSFYGSI